MFKPIQTSTNNQGRFLLLGFLIALSLIIMVSDQLGLLRPAEQVTSIVLNPVESATFHLGQNLSDARVFFSDLQKLRSENDDLRAQLDKARGNEAKIADLLNQLDIQKRQEQFLSNPAYKNFTKVPADVINHDTTGQNQTITINRGANDGVKRGKPVVDSAGYLVGRVQQVKADQSVIMLITDNSVAVDVINQRYDNNSSKVDILPADGSAVGEWQTGGRVSVLHLKPDADVKPGDWIFTSGFNNTFPPNILVGFLDKVLKEPGQSEQQATLVPIADLSHLSQIWVITDW